MRSILFINPPHFRLTGKIYIYLPLGICSLAAITRDAGYETYVYNMDNPPMVSGIFEKYREENAGRDERELLLMNLAGDPIGVFEELRNVLEDVRPDVIALTGLTPQVPFAKKIAEIVKEENPGTTVIMGGIHASLCPEELIREKAIDFVFSGEAEEGIIEFLSALKKGVQPEGLAKIKGLSFKNGGDIVVAKDRPLISVEKYPMPARDLMVFPERIQPKNMGLIASARGCPFRCNFCSSPRLSGFKVRTRTLEQMIDEVEHIVKTYGINEFMFWEDTFVANKKRVRRFCEILKERGLIIRWRCHTRLDTLNEEVLQMMAGSGCTQINVGIESGSKKILEYLNKKITPEEIVKKLELLRKSGIAWMANFMIGYPEETADDVRETIEFIKNEVRNQISINVCVPFPGTQFFDDCVALGFIDNTKPIDWTTFTTKSRFACFSKYLSPDDLRGFIEEIQKAVEPYPMNNPGAFSPCERV